jgi:hypothetical protein
MVQNLPFLSLITLKQICSPLGFDHYATLFPQACVTLYALISEAVGRQSFRIKPDQGMYVCHSHFSSGIESFYCTVGAASVGIPSRHSADCFHSGLAALLRKAPNSPVTCSRGGVATSRE